MRRRPFRANRSERPDRPLASMRSVRSIRSFVAPVVPALALVLVEAAVSGCTSPVGIARLPPAPVQVDEFLQKRAALVDILWVVDDSGSTADKQQLLATSFNHFITALNTCQGTGAAGDVCDVSSSRCTVSGTACHPPDYHIGVITLDVHSSVDQGRLRRAGVCAPGTGVPPAGGHYRYCQSMLDCMADPADAASDPANTACDLTDPVAFVTAHTPNGVGAFQRIVRVGTGGSANDQGIRAAAMAVGRDQNRSTGQWNPIPPENAGFLRDDAVLFLIFVTDGVELSFGEVSYFYRAFQSLKGAGNDGMVSISAIVGDPDLDGPAGPLPGGCTGPAAGQSAKAGTRYIALSAYSRGIGNELRVCDGQRLTCPTATSTCATPIPALPGMCLPVSCQADQDCGSFGCQGPACAQCRQGKCALSAGNYAQILRQRVVYGSICSGDFSQVLDGLGFAAAGLDRKFRLTRPPDCTKPVECCAAGTPDAAGCSAAAPVCVRVAGQPVPNDRASGWTYEPSSGAVFFGGSFIPPSAAEVSATYTVSETGNVVGCSAALR